MLYSVIMREKEQYAHDASAFASAPYPQSSGRMSSAQPARRDPVSPFNRNAKDEELVAVTHHQQALRRTVKSQRISFSSRASVWPT